MLALSTFAKGAQKDISPNLLQSVISLTQLHPLCQCLIPKQVWESCQTSNSVAFPLQSCIQYASFLSPSKFRKVAQTSSPNLLAGGISLINVHTICSLFAPWQVWESCATSTFSKLARGNISCQRCIYYANSLPHSKFREVVQKTIPPKLLGVVFP